MSSRKLRLRLTRKADQDLQDILQYTLDERDQEQQERYADTLERGFILLVEHPGIGRARDDLAPGARTYPVGQHLVIYDVRGTTLRILRIVHGRTDLRRAMR